jgi:hypothetical protein
MPGVSEPGDRFGAAVPGGNGDCVWIGVPGESVGDVAAAGDVIRTHIAFNTGRLKPFGYTIRLGGGGPDNLPGPLQAGAHVGSALSTLAVSNEGMEFAGGEGVVVSAPTLGIGGVTNAGEIWVSNNHGSLSVGGAGIYRDSAGPRAHALCGSPAGMVTNGAPVTN